MTSPPPVFTPPRVAATMIFFGLQTWGVALDPVCVQADRRDIVCTVDFPPINGKYLGWDVVFHWDGKTIAPHILVIPQA